MGEYLLVSFMLVVSCLQPSVYADSSTNEGGVNSERFENGIESLEEISGKGAGKGLVKAFSSISPELSKIIVEYGFGDIYSRDLLDNRTKEMAIIANLIAGGAPASQMKSHINAALNVGCTTNELKEIIIQMTVYAGFPKANSVMFILKEELEKRKKKGIKDRDGNNNSLSGKNNKSHFDAGVEIYSELKIGTVEALQQRFDNVSVDLPKLIIGYEFGEILSRPGLSLRDRELFTISALTALGTAESLLKTHISAALSIGVSKEEVAELMIILSLYSGIPSAINGTVILDDIVNGDTDKNVVCTDSLKIEWEVFGFSMPESVLHSTGHEWLYVSNVNGKDSGYISRLSKDGSVDNLKWVEGLNDPAGMGLYDGKLYVADQNMLRVIDAVSGKLIESIVSEDAKALNDVTINSDGQVFISDIFGGKIYTFEGGKLTVWLENTEFSYPNGILAHGENLLVANWGGSLTKDLNKDDYGALYRVDILDKSVSMIPTSYELGRLDGIALMKDGFLVSHATTGQLFYITDFERVLVGTLEAGLSDIGSDSEGGLVYAPFLDGNRVVCYKISNK